MLCTRSKERTGATMQMGLPLPSIRHSLPAQVVLLSTWMSSIWNKITQVPQQIHLVLLSKCVGLTAPTKQWAIVLVGISNAGATGRTGWSSARRRPTPSHLGFSYWGRYQHLEESTKFSMKKAKVRWLGKYNKVPKSRLLPWGRPFISLRGIVERLDFDQTASE